MRLGNRLALHRLIERISDFDTSRQRQDGINALAQDTGGKAFFNTNYLKGAVEKALDLNRTYYALAYYPPDEVRS
jgi:hypothetical protein